MLCIEYCTCFMFNLKGVPQFGYCAIKKTQNGSAVSQTEFRSSTCDSKLESTWPRLRLDSAAVNMIWPPANNKNIVSITYCASALHIHIESPLFELSLSPLSSTPLFTSSSTTNRTTTCSGTSQLSNMATTTSSNGPRSFALLVWVALHALIILLLSAVIIILIFLILLVVRRKRALHTKGMLQV